VIAQYYVLIRLGKKGFTSIMHNLNNTANHLAEKLESTGRFKILSDRNGNGLPLVAFSLVDRQHYNEFDVAARLRERGWIVPAYTMAPHVEHLKLLRVVIREDFSHHRCEMLIKDILNVVELLDQLDADTVQLHRHSNKSKSGWALVRNVTTALKGHMDITLNKTNGVC